MASKSLIDPEPDPSDRRRNIITITPAGEKRLAAVTAVQDTLLAALSPVARRTLVDLLARVLDSNH